MQGLECNFYDVEIHCSRPRKVFVWSGLQILVLYGFRYSVLIENVLEYTLALETAPGYGQLRAAVS
jgi:hypothetical protein